jgi:hypothetical protein
MRASRPALVALLLMFVIGAVSTATAQIHLDLSGAQFELQAPERLRIRQVTFPGYPGRYWVDVEWDATGLVFVPVDHGPENPGGPVGPGGEFGFGAVGALAPAPGGSCGVLEAELLLDGFVLNRRVFQPANSGAIILDKSDLYIARGQHRLSLRLVRQAASPCTYLVQLHAVVLQLATGFSQQISLPGGIVTVSLSSGQSVNLDFTAGPSP